MKKILLAATLILVYNNSMASCQSTVIVSPDGKVTSCMVCPNVVTCQ